MRRADELGEAGLELTEQRAERQPAGAEHFEHPLLLALADHGPRERDGLGDGRRGRVGPRHEPGAEDAAASDERRLEETRIPYSSESTSASHEASITFSETPIEPHT